jgi:hypothetical protein
MIDIQFDSAVNEEDGTISAYYKAYDGQRLVRNIHVQGKDGADLKAKLAARVEHIEKFEKDGAGVRDIAKAAMNEVNAELAAKEGK